MRYGLLAFLLAATLLFSARSGQAQDNTPGLIDQARQSFRPVTSDEVGKARAELARRMRDVERLVNPASTNGKKWLSYLKWGDLKKALESDGPPNLETMEATLNRLNRDENGLELTKFRALADALQRYRD